MKYLLAIGISALAALTLLVTGRHLEDAPLLRMAVYPARYVGDPDPVDFTDVARTAVVATVRVSARVHDDYGGRGTASGSGAILSEDGYIVTNHHVVKGADGVTVTLYNHRSFKARIVGADAAPDIAVLKIEAQHLPFFSYGHCDELKVGQWVLAIGYPLGLETTVTAGIVSAKGGKLIQTDAAVNLGNSGGPLVDREGRPVR